MSGPCLYCEEPVEGGAVEHAECREYREALEMEKHDVEQWKARRDAIRPSGARSLPRTQEQLDDDANDARDRAKESRLDRPWGEE